MGIIKKKPRVRIGKLIVKKYQLPKRVRIGKLVIIKRVDGGKS